MDLITRGGPVNSHVGNGSHYTLSFTLPSISGCSCGSDQPSNQDMPLDSRQVDKPIRKLRKLLRKFLRKVKVKELHNPPQLAENGTNQEFVESRDDVKDTISEWHDWVELQAIAEKVREHPLCGAYLRIEKRGRALPASFEPRRRVAEKVLGSIDPEASWKPNLRVLIHLCRPRPQHWQPKWEQAGVSRIVCNSHLAGCTQILVDASRSFVARDTAMMAKDT